MDFLEVLKVIFFGMIEGITEWLPVSSTGHMILAEAFLPLNVSGAFFEMFLVVIQLGAIMAVVILFRKKLMPFSLKKDMPFINKDMLHLWSRVIIAVLPAIIIGLPFDDMIENIFYTPKTVALMLIIYGVLFIIIEGRRKSSAFTINAIAEMPYKTALYIGFFQVLALIPGTSRSGATIIGAMLIGTSRAVAAEFTFYLAIPVMFGASLLKIIKFGFAFTGSELIMLLTGMITALIVSIFVIQFLMDYIRKHDFKVFGWYRIILGILLLIYF